jgi:hypothetical protein
VLHSCIVGPAPAVAEVGGDFEGGGAVVFVIPKLAPVPHTAARDSAQLVEPTPPASCAALYFSLHCFIVSALAGCANAPRINAATKMETRNSLLDIASSSRID